MSILDRMRDRNKSRKDSLIIINRAGFKCFFCKMFYTFPNSRYVQNSRDVICCGRTYRQGEGEAEVESPSRIIL